jgi:hypothetical protein
MSTSVIIQYLNVVSFATPPDEADSPLVIDPDAVLSSTIALLGQGAISNRKLMRRANLNYTPTAKYHNQFRECLKLVKIVRYVHDRNAHFCDNASQMWQQ